MKNRAGLVVGVAVLLVIGAACGQRGEQVVDSLMASDETQVSPAFRLRGNEPFWALDIDSAGMVFRTPEDTAGNRFPASLPIAVGDTLRWNSANEVSRIEVVVTKQQCSDSMADKTWTHTAMVMIDQRHLEGCAEEAP